MLTEQFCALCKSDIKHNEYPNRSSAGHWTETSSLVWGDWWWSSWRVQSNYVINFGNCGESLWRSLLHTYAAHACMYSMLYAVRYSLTHTHTHTHYSTLQYTFSTCSLKVCCQGGNWELRDGITGDTDSNSRQNTFEGFYDVRWQSLSVDKLQSVFTGMSESSPLSAPAPVRYCIKPSVTWCSFSLERRVQITHVPAVERYKLFHNSL